MRCPIQPVPVVITLLLSAIVAVPAQCQSKTGQPPLNRSVESAKLAAKQRCSAFHNKWDKLFGSIGTTAQFRGMAKEVVSFDEKFAQGSWVLNQSADPIEVRMRASLHRNVLNEREWLQAMTKSIAEFQTELIKETVELYVKAGFDRERVEQHFKPIKIDCAIWAPTFDRLVLKAKSLALTDWGRIAAVHVGSDLVTDAVFDIGRQRGNWTAEKGGWLDVLGKFATQALVEGVVERATDPTDRVAKELQAEFAKARDAVLSGKHGLKWLATRLTEMHVDVRNRDFGLTTKGAK